MIKIGATALLLLLLAAIASGSTFNETSSHVLINGESLNHIELAGMKVTGNYQFKGAITTNGLHVEVDHSDYKRQPAGVSAEPEIYTTVPEDQSKSSILEGKGDDYVFYVFPVSNSELPSLTATSSALVASSHKTSEFSQEVHQFQERALPSVNVDDTTFLELNAEALSIVGTFFMVAWELKITLLEDNATFYTGYSQENQTYLPDGQVLTEDRYRRIAYLEAFNGVLNLETTNATIEIYSQKFAATSSTPPLFQDGRSVGNFNESSEYVLTGTQNGDQIDLVLETPIADQDGQPEPEPQVTVSQAVIPKWLIILGATLPLPIVLSTVLASMYFATLNVEARARRGQLISATVLSRFLPKKLRERQLRANCISSYKQNNEAELLQLKQAVSQASASTRAFHGFLLAKLYVQIGRFQDAKASVRACLKLDDKFATEIALDPSLQPLSSAL